MRTYSVAAAIVEIFVCHLAAFRLLEEVSARSRKRERVQLLKSGYQESLDRFDASHKSKSKDTEIFFHHDSAMP